MTNQRKLAVLGGDALFAQPVPITQPTLPSVDALRPALERIFDSGMVTNAENVRELEAEAAHYFGVKHAVAVSSCTSGLLLVWRAWGLKGEVILPSFTFPATGHALLWNGLRPHFVDIDPLTFNLDPQKVEEAIGPETVGILAVHIFGNPAWPDRLEEIASARGLKLLFDSAHAIGATYRGQPVGGFGDAEVFSLSPTKPVVSLEGGLVTTNDDELARCIRIGRDYGNPGDYDTEFAGLNARMAEVNAVVGVQTLRMLEQNLERRWRLADLYYSRLGELPGLSFQQTTPGATSTYKDFSVLLNPDDFGLTRDELALALQPEGVITRKYYYPPIHQQKSFAAYGKEYADKLPNTEQVGNNVLCLPLFSHMPEETLQRICDCVELIHSNRKEVRAFLTNRR